MGNRSDLFVLQGIQYRSVEETFPYTIDVSNWNISLVTAATGTLFDITDGKTDVTTAVLSATASIASSTNITTESFTANAMTAGNRYQYECRFTANSEDYEFRIPVKVIF